MMQVRDAVLPGSTVELRHSGGGVHWPSASPCRPEPPTDPRTWRISAHGRPWKSRSTPNPTPPPKPPTATGKPPHLQRFALLLLARGAAHRRAREGKAASRADQDLLDPEGRVIAD